MAIVTDTQVIFGDTAIDLLVVYCSCPMSIGDQEANAIRGVALGQEVLDHGYIPIVPALSHWWHRYYDNSYEKWLAMDFGLILRCDALLWIPGPSIGVELEKQFARENHIPVFDTIEELDIQRDYLLSKRVYTREDYLEELL